jgi:hypothetical protein
MYVSFVLTSPIAQDDGVDFTPDDAYPLVIELHTAASARATADLHLAWCGDRLCWP